MRTLLPLLACALFAAEYPTIEIANRDIRAVVLLPDAEKGYYRGTRFDWSGAILSLKYAGHEYFGQWFDKYNPKTHDAVAGPVEAFQGEDGALGYAEAPVGGTFIRIGVGAVRKPEEKAFQAFRTYDIVDPGKWTVKPGRDAVAFVHELSAAGYGYRYAKTLKLAVEAPELIIEHTLRNTGSKPIRTSQYNHNFFVIDGRPTGPDSVIRFGFDIKPTRDLKGLAEARGRELRYLRELEKGESVYTELAGSGATAADYDIAIENRAAGAGVRISGDRPLLKTVYWSIRTTTCPEPYIDVSVEPGQETSWRIAYRFYELKK